MTTAGTYTGRGMITVALAFGLPAVRVALRRLLESEHDLTVVAEAGDVRASEASVLAHQPRVLIIGRDLPGLPTPDGIARAASPSPGTSVVVLGLDDHQTAAQAALAAGAQGYVTLERAGAELAPAVRAAAGGSRPAEDH